MKSKTTVIIADDHPIFRKGLREIIASNPELHLLEDVHDGDQALRAIEELRPTIAIVDFHMPKRTGLDILRAIGKKNLPVKMILLTMHDDEELFNEAMSLGAGGYVLKESAVSDLLSAIQFVLEGKTFISPSLSHLVLKRRGKIELLRKTKPGLEKLTPTERRILKLVAADRTTKEIADDLQISPRTVETHRQNISSKLELSGSHSLLKFAYDHKTRL